MNTMSTLLHVQKRLSLVPGVSAQVVNTKVNGTFAIIAEVAINDTQALRAVVTVSRAQLNKAVVPEILLDDICEQLILSLLRTQWRTQNEQG